MSALRFPLVELLNSGLSGFRLPSEDSPSSSSSLLMWLTRVVFAPISSANGSVSILGMSTQIAMLLVRHSFWWFLLEVHSWLCGT